MSCSNLPNYDLVIPALLNAGIDGLQEKCKLTPGVPLKPMLAKPTKAIGEVLDKFEGKKFTCEYKYDGERAQVSLHSTAAATELPSLICATFTGPQAGGWHDCSLQPQFRRHEQEVPGSYGTAASGTSFPLPLKLPPPSSKLSGDPLV